MNLDSKHLKNTTKRPVQLAPSLSTDLEFAIINGETALPSKSKFYHNKLVYVRGLRYREQLEISQIAKQVDDPSTAYHSVLRVYKNCIEIEGVDFHNILEEDFTTLTFWVVLLTNPEQVYQLSYTCKGCNETTRQDITPAQIELLDFELYEPQVVQTSLGQLLIAPLTMQENLWAYNADSNGINESLILGKHIKSRDGQPIDTLQERLDLFGALALNEVGMVRSTAMKFKSGIKSIQCQCLKCKHTQSVTPTIDILRGLP